MAKRRGRNSVNQQVLDDIVKMFANTLGFSEAKIKELYDANQALKAAGGSPGGAGSPVNVNYQGDITDPNLQLRLVNLMETIIDKVQNDPTFGQGGNFNIQIGVPKKPAKRRRSTTPRVTNKALRDYIEQRADQIVQLIQNIPPGQSQQGSVVYDDTQLRQLITTVAQDIRTQYSTIDSRLGRIEGTLGGFGGKLDQILTGQTRLSREHDRLSEEHRGLNEEHRELRRGQSAIIDKLQDLELQYKDLEAAVKAIQPYDTAALVTMIRDGFDDLKRRVNGIQTHAYDDTQLRALLDRKFTDLRQRVDQIVPEIKDVQTTLASMQTKLNSLHNYDDAYIRSELSTLGKTLAGMQTKLDGLHNYDDTLLMAEVSNIKAAVTGMQTKLSGLHNYDDSQLKHLIGNLRTRVANMQGTLNGLHNYDDRSLRAMIHGEIDSVKQDVGKIKPYDDTNLRADIRALASDLSDVKTTVARLHNYDDSQLKAEVVDVQKTLAAMQTKLDSLDNYDDAALKQLVNDVHRDLTAVQTKVNGLDNYDDTQLVAEIGDIKTALSGLETKVDAITPYDDTQLKADLNARLDDLKNAVDGIQPYDDSNLLTSLTGMASTLGEVKGKVDGLAQTDAAVMGSLSGIMGALARIGGNLGGNVFDDSDLKQLINDKYVELVEKYGELTTLIAEKAGEVNTYLAQRLGEFATREELAQILDGRLQNLPNQASEDIRRIYDVNRTIRELLQEMFEKLDSIEQNYGQQQPAPGQNAPQQPVQLDDEQLNAIMEDVAYIRNELENGPNVYTDEDRRLLADIYHRIEERLGENRGEGNRRFDELRNEISQLRDYIQGSGQGARQPPGQQPPAQGDDGGQPPAGEGQPPRDEQAQEGEGQPPRDQQADGEPQPDDQQQDQQRDESPRLEDEQQPVGDRLERQLEPAPSVEVGEQGIEAFYKAGTKAERLVRGRDRLLRETYLRAEQGLVSEDGREVDLSKLKEYDEKRAFENRAVGCIATLAKQLYGDFSDMFTESDVMISLVGFDRTFVRHMVDQLGENLSFDRYYQSVTRASKETRERILRLPSLCLDEPHRKPVVAYTGTEGRVNPEALSVEDMIELLSIHKEMAEVPTGAIKEKPYFIPQPEGLPQAA